MKKLLILACVFFSTASFAADRVIINPDSNANVKIKVSPAGVPTDAITVNGTTGVTSLGQPLPIASGGTGAINDTTARTNLGLGSLAVLSTVVNTNVDAGAAIEATKIQPASSTTGGVMTIAAQDVQGIKTFIDNPLVVARNSGSVSISNVSLSTVIFDTEDKDVGAGYDTSTGIFKAPASGTYSVSVFLFSSSTLQNFSVLLQTMVNNDTAYPSALTKFYDNTVNQEVFLNSSGLFRLAVNDTVRIQALCTGTAAITCAASAGRAKLHIVRVGAY